MFAVFQAIGSIASEAPASQDLALFNRCEWRCRVPRATPRIRLIQITISEAVSTEDRATQLATECRLRCAGPCGSSFSICDTVAYEIGRASSRERVWQFG